MTRKQKRELPDDYMLLTGLVLATGLSPKSILANARRLQKLQENKDVIQPQEEPSSVDKEAHHRNMKGKLGGS
jgi:hypothetical protein